VAFPIPIPVPSPKEIWDGIGKAKRRVGHWIRPHRILIVGHFEAGRARLFHFIKYGEGGVHGPNAPEVIFSFPDESTKFPMPKATGSEEKIEVSRMVKTSFGAAPAIQAGLLSSEKPIILIVIFAANNGEAHAWFKTFSDHHL
jgi:hypothetical protein